MQEQIAKTSSGISYLASGATAGFGALSANEIAAIGGLALGALTFCVNWYYRHKHYQLAVENMRPSRDQERGGSDGV